MGTTVSDVLNPEFMLSGTKGVTGIDVLVDLWAPVWPKSPPWHVVSWETAELTKMAYNTFIGAKLGIANTVGWLAEEVGADGGQVMEILSQATRRIVSPSYMKPGLGDGGACHPRDQIALSWLAQKHGVYDLFGDLIEQRLAHSEWIASVARATADVEGIEDIVILGAAYKADSTLIDGSPALLLANQTGWPIVERPPSESCVVVIGVPHTRYKAADLSKHVVVDPWGYLPGAVTPGRRQPD
jgi:UDPglucose 6-dehydrogenase